MVSYKLLSVLAAASLAAAANSPCTSNNFTINTQSDVSQIQGCETVQGDVIIGDQASTIDLSGPTTFSGNLQVMNNGVLTSLQSTTLREITGSFTMTNVTQLNGLTFQSLTKVGSIAWTSLPALTQLSAGITEANSVTISDTYLASLEGIDLVTVGTMDLNNNERLSEIDVQLTNVTTLFTLNSNGLQLSVSLPNLTWAAELDFSNVTSLSMPSLVVVNGSMDMNSNFFTSFTAPNLTMTETGDISFASNGNLKNLTFPKLTQVGGAVIVANNTQLASIEAFPKLSYIGGAIAMRGSFTNFSFPDLTNCNGTADVTSTTDIAASCAVFLEDAPTSQGGNGKIQGKVDCTSNNTDANNNTGSTSTGGTGGTSSGSGSGSNKASAAAGVGANAAAVFGFTVLAGLVAFML